MYQTYQNNVYPVGVCGSGWQRVVLPPICQCTKHVVMGWFLVVCVIVKIALKSNYKKNHEQTNTMQGCSFKSLHVNKYLMSRGKDWSTQMDWIQKNRLPTTYNCNCSLQIDYLVVMLLADIINPIYRPIKCKNDF